MSKAPAFQLYVGDFMSDPLVDAMTPEELGGYFRLLLVAWQQDDTGYLPSDQRLLAAWSRLGPRWGECSIAIMCCFKLAADGRFYQKRMVEVAAQQEAFREKQKANAASRWSHGNATAYATALPTHMPSACSSISDLRSSSSKTDTDRKKQRPAQKPKAPPTEVYQVVEAWKTGWVERFKPSEGRAPEPNDPDWKQAKNLLAAHGLTKTLELVVRFLDDTDKLVAERGHMLRDLPSRVARYAKGDGPLFRNGNQKPRDHVEEGYDALEEFGT